MKLIHPHSKQGWGVKRSIVFAQILLLGLSARAGNGPGGAPRDGAALDQAGSVGTRGDWFKQSRFAMFIHWGLYSQLADRWDGKTYYGISEWLMNRAKIPVREYERVALQFNPTNFNAHEWVSLARAAGMDRIMVTAKHHEGFAMFGSKASPYNIVDDTPFHRDPLKELARECQAQGVRLGFYYSQTIDWHESNAVGNTWDWPENGRRFQDYFEAKAVPQIREILTGYGPVAGIWFDTPGPISVEDSKALVSLVHRLQPQCLVNSRIGHDLGDYDTLDDQEIPSLPRPGLWESIDTMNDTWGYAWYDRNWKSPREIVERLVRVVSRNGTYMLNVGPDGTGRIPPQCASILREVGAWVHKHDQVINGSGPTPLGPVAWGECTTRGNLLYACIFNWPDDGRLVLPCLKTDITGATFENGESLRVESFGDYDVVILPPRPANALVPVVTISFTQPPVPCREQLVLNHFSNTLLSSSATLCGCEEATLHWMEKFGDWKHSDCIGAWKGAGSSVTWTFNTVSPGSFYVDVNYTCPSTNDYSEWRIQTADKDLNFPLIDTGERLERKIFGGDFPRFSTYRVGLVDFSHSGVQRLTLNPMTSDGNGIRVASVSLVPIN